MAQATTTFNAGSAIVQPGEQDTLGGPIRPVVAADPSARMRLLMRLNYLQNIWLLEGGEGDCPDETDTDLVADNPLQ